MEEIADTYGVDPDGDYAHGAQWQDTIQLLRLVRSDYQGARKQLETVNRTLAQREALVSQRLQYALLASSGYHTLCLVSYGVESVTSQMGKTILGEAAQPSALPGTTRLEVRCLGRFEVSSAWQKVER